MSRFQTVNFLIIIMSIFLCSIAVGYSDLLLGKSFRYNSSQISFGKEIILSDKIDNNIIVFQTGDSSHAADSQGINQKDGIFFVMENQSIYQSGASVGFYLDKSNIDVEKFRGDKLLTVRDSKFTDYRVLKNLVNFLKSISRSQDILFRTNSKSGDGSNINDLIQYLDQDKNRYFKIIVKLNSFIIEKNDNYMKIANIAYTKGNSTISINWKNAKFKSLKNKLLYWLIINSDEDSVYELRFDGNFLVNVEDGTKWKLVK